MNTVPHGLRCDCDQCHEDHYGDTVDGANLFDGGQGRSQESVRTEGEVLLVYVACAILIAAILLTWWVVA